MSFSSPWATSAAALAVILSAAACAGPRAAGGPVTPAAPRFDLAALEAELVAKHGEPERARIHRGLAQVQALWRAEDGDLPEFARAYFISDPTQREATFRRFESLLEQLDGALNDVGRELRKPSDVDIGPGLPVDGLFAGLDVSAHIGDDLFASKLGFVVLLNHPLTTLEERLSHADTYSRRDWAELRLAGRFSSRVPADVRQAQATALSAADAYISGYNVWMHHVLAANGERLFPKGKRLISHWNLRDELKANYADPRGLEKQRILFKIMDRIVTQTIPAQVIDNPRLDWEPFANRVTVAPAEFVEDDAPAGRTAVADAAAEPCTRYAHLLANFRAAKLADPHSPTAPTAIARAYEFNQELPEARVRAMLEKVLGSPLVPRLAKEAERKLGRPLEPQDVWYAGFVPRPPMEERELDALTRKRYPNADAFAADLPRLLRELGFAPARADYLASHIRVDPSRGAGHAMQAMRRGDFPHLRTRIEKDGMNYKGYNIAVHELGHNVEQVFSLYDVDSTLLAGVPNNAFTEALAFVFQARDLELLGVVKPDKEAARSRVLAAFWSAWEIAGVAVVDTEVWHWMYDHPDATPEQLRDATVGIAQGVWDKYYAPVLGGKGTTLLGIYSHMISYPLYLTAYPVGRLIALQLEEQFARVGQLGPEFERVSRQGSVLPDVWMKGASGLPVGPEPLIEATECALAGGPVK